MKIQGTVDMAPGVYVIDGATGNGLEIGSKADVTGEGVTFYLINGAEIRINGDATINVRAPTDDPTDPTDDDDPYNGILFFVGRGEDETYLINGGPLISLNGAIYAPDGEIEMKGHSPIDGGCIQVVAGRILLTGSNEMSVDCTDSDVNGIKTEQLVTLVE
jgi:hypothetical protein